jgi:lipoprotein signal peptidase
MELVQNIFHATFNTGISFGIGIPQVAIQITTTLFLILIIHLLYTKKIHPIIAALIIAGGL